VGYPARMTWLLLAGCAPRLIDPTPVAPFRFAVVGDRTGEPNDADWRRVLGEVEARGPDLVVTVGDLADDAFNPAEWDRALAGTALLERPIAYTPGNHDILDAASAAIFTTRTGQAPYRSFDQGELHFVIVDNSIAERWEELPEEQRLWLEADLAGSVGRPTFVFMHKPFWALGVAAGTPDPMHDLFVRTGVAAVFTGHWHTHLHARFDGIAYTGVGSSGGVTAGLPDPRRGNVPEFVEATVRDGAVTLTTVIEGEEHPVDLVSARDQGVLRQLHKGAVTGRLHAAADGTSRLDLHVENLGAEPLAGTLTVDGGAWSVAQPSVALDVAPGATFTTTIPVTRGVTDVPLPRVRLDYPLPDAGLTPFETVVDHARELRVGRGPAPVLDGVIGPDEWAGAAVVDQFVTSRGVAATGDPTRVLLRYDADALYVAARCDDGEPAALTRIHSARDGGVEFDDRIGVLLAPTPDQLYWFYANPNGAVWDLHADRARGVVNRDWNGVEARATVDATGWSVEARVPFDAMGLTTVPETWAFDLRRRNNRLQVEAQFTPAFGTSQAGRIGVMRLVEGAGAPK
jgi:hypothetical protein